jgi:chromosome segregation ATPase
MLLNRRLKRLKADEHSLKAVIGELITATEIAERAIGGLKHTVRDVNENLGGQLTAAAQLSEHLKRQLAEGDHVVRRLTKIAIAARPSQMTEAELKEPAPREPVALDLAPRDAAAKPTNAKALAAAAQAFSERRRAGGLAA